MQFHSLLHMINGLIERGWNENSRKNFSPKVIPYPTKFWSKRKKIIPHPPLKGIPNDHSSLLINTLPCETFCGVVVGLRELVVWSNFIISSAPSRRNQTRDKNLKFNSFIFLNHITLCYILHQSCWTWRVSLEQFHNFICSCFEELKLNSIT